MSFQECESLESIIFIKKKKKKKKKIIPYSTTNHASYDTSGKNSISIKNVIIGDKSFNLCTNLNTLIIHAAEEVILCDECFYNLTNLYNKCAIYKNG